MLCWVGGDANTAGGVLGAAGARKQEEVGKAGVPVRLTLRGFCWITESEFFVSLE